MAAVELAVLEATAAVSEALKCGGVGSRSSNSTASAETAAVGETTSAALIGESIGVSVVELKNPLLQIKRQLMNSADQTETRVEVEVEYEGRGGTWQGGDQAAASCYESGYLQWQRIE